jgi:hypothetical protein
MSINIRSNIGQAGTEFSVVDGKGNNSLLTGTKGMTSFVLGSDHGCSNVLFQNCLVSRRGKGGKDRMEQVSLISPLIDIEGVPIDVLIPNIDKYKQLVLIETLTEDRPVLSMSDNDCINWLYTNFMFLKTLSDAKINKNSRLYGKLPIHPDKMIRLWRIEDGNELMMSFMENIVELFDSGSEEDIEYINHNYLSNKVNLVALARNLYHRNTLVHMDYMIKVLMLEINAMEYIMKNISAKKDSINELDIDELFSELKNRMKALKGMKTELSNKMDKKISSFSKNMANYAKNKEKIVGKKAQMIEPLAAAMDL